MSRQKLVTGNQPAPSGHNINPKPPQPRGPGSVERVADLEDRRNSLPLAQLKEQEEKFFQLVEAGDEPSVERFLNERRALNVNCVNYKGLSALQIAIKKSDHEMVKLLLSRQDIEVKDASLHAVESGNMEITKTVLDFIKSTNREAEMQGCWESAEYAPDITPLALAAKCGDFKMVRMLLERGHEMEKPHPPTCLCPMCKESLRESGTSGTSQKRLHAYRAICNPVYICQVTNDPILYAFFLDRELKECSQVDKEFTNEYQELGNDVREFPVNLLSACRDAAEVEMLLKLPMGYDVKQHIPTYPRLQVALDYYQKEFVAHSMVQQVLSAHWLGEFRSWSRLSIYMQLLHVVMRILLFIFICIALLVAPTKLMRTFYSPVNRFLMSLAAYIIFLGFVFLINILDVGNFKRGSPHTGLEGFVIVFTLGHIWSTIRQLKTEGRKRFFSIPWNWYDIMMEFFFIMTYIFWAVADSAVRTDEIEKKEVQERKFWDSLDPTLVHEGLFAMATVLAAGKLTYYCLQSTRLGPYQVSMGKMAVQIAYFLIMCFIINTSFAIPLSRMYSYYSGMQQKTESGTKSQESSFISFSNAFSTLFWGMFGMSPVEAADVVVENLSDDLNNPVINTHDFTQGVGRTLFAIYELLMLIALVNTLIAILSNTFQKVCDNVDVEFKFNRTKMWTHFFHDRTLLPSPFNLIPSIKCFQFCSKYMKGMGNKKGDKSKFSFSRCCYIDYEKERDPIDMEAYEALMSNLVQRYFSAKDDEEEDD